MVKQDQGTGCPYCGDEITPTNYLMGFVVHRKDGDYHAVCALKDSCSLLPEFQNYTDLTKAKPTEKRCDNCCKSEQ